MHKYILILILGLVVPAVAQPLLMQQEDNFFGIPGLPSLSAKWFIEQSDSTDAGFNYPVDVELLKLSARDYRVIILDAFNTHFYALPLDQQNGLSLNDIIPSCTAPDTCAYAVAMCLMQSDTFFPSSRGS